MREEHDLLGFGKVPKTAYFGIQTQRALDNFDLSGVNLSHFPHLVRALALVKCACAQANFDLGLLEQHKLEAIQHAVKQIMDGQYHEEFVVDLIQGGAGTSTNMNANEVIANIGLEFMGYPKGEYKHLNPNNDVNLSQSTNDAYPTAVRLAILMKQDELMGALIQLKSSLSEKAEEFKSIIKMGRTQLQDAVPMTLGQEFKSFASTLGEDIDRTNEMFELLKEINLGGTAIGTGINTQSGYKDRVVNELCSLTGIQFTSASDLIEASSDMGAFVLISGMLKRIAVKLSKISNDLRLLSMGPRCGLNEINLPMRQPGSSIMPGKVNPVIPEAMNQIAFQVIGNDLAITFAAEAGQLQLNAMEPLIAYNILESIRLLTKSMRMMNTHCVSGITANEDICKGMVDNSIGVITALNPYVGYEVATRLAKSSLETGISITQLVLNEGLMSEKDLAAALNPQNMVSL